MVQALIQLADFVVRAIAFYVSNSPDAEREWQEVTAALQGMEAPQPGQPPAASGDTPIGRMFR